MGAKKLFGFAVLAMAVAAPFLSTNAATAASGPTTTACVHPYPISNCPPPSVPVTTEPVTTEPGSTTTAPAVSPSVGGNGQASQGGSALALTGADIGILVAFGAIVITLGVLLVRIARRRA